ncbi:putative yeats family protein [Paratrimastix pyriformis]|uniref:Yeats family protein n=1 Tax=Paratrimastix pyriformis TaxID=342808 RepID=A0ABQ8UTC8_9EUKA|nr:putative yeats family protein [Paratrimastix pyriformis]
MNPRLDRIIPKVIAYGNSSLYLGKRAPKDKTHRWTIYVRSPYGEELSEWISKVVFELHESFSNHMREVTKAPYELTEVGWGEFEIRIHIHFVRNEEPPIVLYLPLKLFPPQDQPESTKVPMINEVCDEILFYRPRLSFAQNLLCCSPQRVRYSQQEWFLDTKFLPSQLASLHGAALKIDMDTRICGVTLQETEAQISQMGEEVAILEQMLTRAGIPLPPEPVFPPPPTPPLGDAGLLEGSAGGGTVPMERVE